MSSEMSGSFCSSTVLCFVLSIFGARESNTRTDRYSAFISQLWKFSPLISCAEWQIANIPTLSCPKYFPFCSTASVTMAGGYATVILKTAVCKSYMQYMHIHWGALKKLNEAWHSRQESEQATNISYNLASHIRLQSPHILLQLYIFLALSPCNDLFIT